MNTAIKDIVYKFTSRVINSSCDKYSAISYMVKLYDSSIGKYSYVSNNCNVFHTSIGNFTSIGLGCNIGGGEHDMSCVSTSPAFEKKRTFRYGISPVIENKPYKQTIIGNDVWIASNVIIKSGLTIADGAVIGAGAVVTHNVGPYEIWAGNPARMIRKRFDDQIIEELLKLQWWNWDDAEIKKYANSFDNPEKLLEIWNRDEIANIDIN